jgi:MOSC domain-containing protein YiiM
MMLENTPGTRGRVVSVNLSERKTVRKTRYECGTLVLDRGFEGDAHAGDWHRQVSLLATESIDEMIAKGLDVGPGDFAENITTEGIDVMTMPVGSILRLGAEEPGGDDIILEISQIGKTCHTRCAIYHQAGDCVMPREGVFAVVRTPGGVAVGDTIEVVSLGNGVCDRTPEDALLASEEVRAANECKKAAARTEGVAMDLTYTGKALAGLVAAVSEGTIRADATVIFLHTGGIPELFTHSIEVCE